MNIAVYPGSFDPCTLAHIDIIKRASQIFDRVYGGVLVNTAKKPVFTPEERVHMLETCISAEGISNCEVRDFQGMLVDFARSVGARHTVRGLRCAADFDSELMMNDLNYKLCPELQTVFFMSEPCYRSLSSSAVREIGKCGGPLLGFVHESVLNMITERLVQL